MKKTIVRLFIAASATLVSAGFAPALACSCMLPPPPKESLAKSDAVFAGKVTRTANTPGQMIATLEVSKWWKGSLRQVVTLTTADNTGACGFPFRTGEEYLVYARQPKGQRHLSTNLCTRTALLAAAKKDLDELGEPRPLEELTTVGTAEKLKQYFGPRLVSILTAPTRVEAFRVDPETWQQGEWGTAKDVDAKATAGLSAVLLDHSTYHWYDNKPTGLRCIFKPAVAYRFWKDKEYVSVLVCFSCSEVRFISNNPADNGNSFKYAIWARLRPEVLDLTKQLFPDDKVLHAIN